MAIAMGPGVAAAQPPVVVKPDAFQTLVNPQCSHCRDEAQRRVKDLRPDDRVLCWIRGYSDGGAIPIRFFLAPHRVISDSYGVFVYDPDAGYARGFAPSYHFRFHGWRRGVVLMRDETDGTLYSCLTGLAVDGPRKGHRLTPVPTLVSDWGAWLKPYPQAVAYHMFDRYQPIALPTTDHPDAVRSRGTPDPRLTADEPVLGVRVGTAARAYPIAALERQRLITDDADGSLVVLWEPTTRTAAAYRPVASQPRKYKAPAPDKDGVSKLDPGVPVPPGAAVVPPRKLTLGVGPTAGRFTDAETHSAWDIAGRCVDGELKGWTLEWVDSVQAKWFAWAAEYPETGIYDRVGSVEPRSGEAHRPDMIVLVEPNTVDTTKIAAWKTEGITSVALVLDDRHTAAVLKSAADTATANGLGVYLWLEVARAPDMARDHPDWMASLGMHADWRQRFPAVRPPEKGEVAKAWPWVPIRSKEAFAAHVARVGRLLERVPAGFRGLLLNDLQGGPASCGCGNLQCRWATDYHVPSMTTVQPDAAPKFLAEVAKLAPGKEVIPVWTTECESEDLPAAKRPPGSWGTGLCGSVPCFDYCRDRFAEQWAAMQKDRIGPTALLALHREFQRDRCDYGGPAAWVSHVVDYCEKQAGPTMVPRQRLWLVVQGYDVDAAEAAASRAVAMQAGVGAVVVARARLDQSYEPRVIKVK
jgi:hypothetical protein